MIYEHYTKEEYKSLVMEILNEELSEYPNRVNCRPYVNFVEDVRIELQKSWGNEVNKLMLEFKEFIYLHWRNNYQVDRVVNAVNNTITKTKVNQYKETFKISDFKAIGCKFN